MKFAATCIAALAAAVLFACSAVLQQRSARQTPDSESLRPRLLLDLLHRPLWLAGGATMLVAYVLQAVALALGRVALVEPLIVTELVVAVPLAARHQGARPRLAEWTGIALVVAGVTAFLLGSSPRGGTSEPSLTRWLLGLLPAAAVTAILLVLARGPRSPRRAALLAAAAATCFGLLSLITKSATGLLARGGLSRLFESWQPEMLCVLGIGGFLIAQSAYQAAPLAVSLPVIDAGQPTVAVLLAAAVLGERLRYGPVHLALEVSGAVASLAGIFVLGRSPLVLSLYGKAQPQSIPPPKTVGVHPGCEPASCARP